MGFPLVNMEKLPETTWVRGWDIKVCVDFGELFLIQWTWVWTVPDNMPRPQTKTKVRYAIDRGSKRYYSLGLLTKYCIE